MSAEEETTENLKRCPRFNNCSVNFCPLDLEVNLRNNLPSEERCPFTINKRVKSQKGIKTQMPPPILEFVPESNVKMLNKRNQKRWHNLHKKDGLK